MRIVAFLLFSITLSLSAQKGREIKDVPAIMNCSEGGCIVNAGQDQVICANDIMELRGESNNEFAEPLNATWRADPNNPMELTIQNPNALVTTVSTTTGTFPPGTYTFSLTVACADGSTSCNETTVTVVELPDIQLIVPETPSCSNTIFLARSAALPEGIAENFALANGTNLLIEEVANGYIITRSASEFNQCSFSFTYTIFTGLSCSQTQFGRFELLDAERDNNFAARNIHCTEENISGRLGFSNPDVSCSVLEVRAIATPTGVNPDEVTYQVGNRSVDFSAPVGNYTFVGTMTNECGIQMDTLEVSCPPTDPTECNRLAFGQTIFLRHLCVDYADLGSLQLALPFFQNASYTWSTDAAPPWLDLQIDASGASAELTFTGDRPVGDNTDEIFLQVMVIDQQNTTCPAIRLTVRITAQVSLGIISDRVNINCGTGTLYSLSNNVNNTRESKFFRVVDYPPGYSGLLAGTLPTGNDVLQLSQLGSYTIELSSVSSFFDHFLQRTILCDLRDTFAIVVDDIPNIDAGSNATICESQVQLNGSTPRNAAGLPVDINLRWETADDYPGVAISDPTIRNPLVTGLEAGQSYTFRYTFPGDPNCEKEDLVTITVKKDCDDDPPLTCDISLESKCYTCGCGKPAFSVTLRDSNGDRFEQGTFTVSWFIDGTPTQVGNNLRSIVTHYDGPLVVTAQVSFTLADGTKCTTEESIAVTCGDDCPEVVLEYATDDCSKDYFYGEVIVVDGAGHPVSAASIDWYADGYVDENPYMVFSEPGEAVPVTVDFYWRKGCTTKLAFEPDCFTGEGIGKRAATAGHTDYATQSAGTGVYPSPVGRNEMVTVPLSDLQPTSLRVIDLSGRQVFQTALPSGAKEYRVSPFTLPTGVMIAVLHDEAGKVLKSLRFVVW